jgi:hypothetical protein
VSLFENLTTLLEDLSYSLPQFQRHFDTLRQRPSNKHMPYAVTLLAFLYADVLQLLQEGIAMLSRGAISIFQIATL